MWLLIKVTEKDFTMVVPTPSAKNTSPIPYFNANGSTSPLRRSKRCLSAGLRVKPDPKRHRSADCPGLFNEANHGIWTLVLQHMRPSWRAMARSAAASKLLQAAVTAPTHLKLKGAYRSFARWEAAEEFKVYEQWLCDQAGFDQWLEVRNSLPPRYALTPSFVGE